MDAALVTFEPGARTAWHSHPLGQRLVANIVIPEPLDGRSADGMETVGEVGDEQYAAGSPSAKAK